MTSSAAHPGCQNSKPPIVIRQGRLANQQGCPDTHFCPAPPSAEDEALIESPEHELFIVATGGRSRLPGHPFTPHVSPVRRSGHPAPAAPSTQLEVSGRAMHVGNGLRLEGTASSPAAPPAAAPTTAFPPPHHVMRRWKQQRQELQQRQQPQQQQQAARVRWRAAAAARDEAEEEGELVLPEEATFGEMPPLRYPGGERPSLPPSLSPWDHPSRSPPPTPGRLPAPPPSLPSLLSAPTPPGAHLPQPAQHDSVGCRVLSADGMASGGAPASLPGPLRHSRNTAARAALCGRQSVPLGCWMRACTRSWGLSLPRGAPHCTFQRRRQRASSPHPSSPSPFGHANLTHHCPIRPRALSSPRLLFHPLFEGFNPFWVHNARLDAPDAKPTLPPTPPCMCPPTHPPTPGYTPFEFIEFSDIPMRHEISVLVAAPVAKCFDLWADRLNWLYWFEDFIDEMGFHEEDPSLVSMYLWYRWGECVWRGRTGTSGTTGPAGVRGGGLVPLVFLG